MRRPQDDANALGLEDIVDRVGDLRRHLFLNLQAPGVGLHHPGEFADANHAPARDVRHPSLTDDRGQVMLAMALEADATEHDHFVIAFDFFEGLLQKQCGILAVASKEFLEGTSDASGSFDQAVSLWIISRPSNDGSERTFDIGSVGPAGLDAFRGPPRSYLQRKHVRIHGYVPGLLRQRRVFLR
jgi:hypothetical protein